MYIQSNTHFFLMCLFPAFLFLMHRPPTLHVHWLLAQPSQAAGAHPHWNSLMAFETPIFHAPVIPEALDELMLHRPPHGR
jgi:hypothetical protein